MTRPDVNRPAGEAPGSPDAAGSPGAPTGEVLISGLDTGPGTGQRENLSPTDEHARFQPAHPAQEPTDEDG